MKGEQQVETALKSYEDVDSWKDCDISLQCSPERSRHKAGDSQ